MFRRAASLLSRPVLSATRPRSLSTDLPAAPTTDSAFVDAWKKAIPNIDPPKTPLSFMQPRPPTPSSIPSKLTVNFVLPYASELSSKEVISSKPFCLFCSFHNSVPVFAVKISSFVGIYGWSCILEFGTDLKGCLIALHVFYGAWYGFGLCRIYVVLVLNFVDELEKFWLESYGYLHFTGIHEI